MFHERSEQTTIEFRNCKIRVKDDSSLIHFSTSVSVSWKRLILLDCVWYSITFGASSLDRNLAPSCLSCRHCSVYADRSVFAELHASRLGTEHRHGRDGDRHDARSDGKRQTVIVAEGYGERCLDRSVLGGEKITQ